MRNLKRALSLALSAAMIVGMMVVGTSAAGYPDVTSANNQEAIEVLQAIAVMTGDDKGNFNPDKNVTRNETAVIMANLLDLKVSDFKGAKLPFTDVPEWAVPYVGACYAAGITSGTSATTYSGDNTVTAAQAALMLLKALGYFQNAGDFGDDWQMATIKQGSKAGLFEGINAGASQAVTRNEVAQMTLNALKATMVEVDGTSGSITTGDITINLGSTKYAEVEKAGKDYTAISGETYKSGEKYTVQLGEELYDGDLVKSTSNNDLGQPGTKWSYDGKEVGVYANAADYSVVLDSDVAADKLAAELKDLADNKDLTNIAKADFWINGNEKDAATDLKSGTAVQLYCDGDKVETIVALDYTLAQITDISTSLTKAQKDDGATCKVKVDGKYYLDTDFADFNAKTYVEDAYILYVAKGSEILASQLAESVEGKVDATKGDDVRIDGTYYTDLTGKVNVGDEGTFYLNLAGQIVEVDATATKSGNYAYIYKMAKDSGLNGDGIKATTYTAYVVLADGTKASYEVKTDEKNGEYYFDNTDIAVAGYKGVIAYSINSDDQLVYKTAKDTISQKDMSVDKNNAAGTSSSTQFIFAYQDGSAMKVSTATGYKNVNFDAKSYVVKNSDGDILYVFVPAKNGSVTTDADLAVVLDAEAVKGENADGDTTYTYAMAVDGKESELTFKDEQDFTEGDVIAYEMDGDYAKLDTNATVYQATKATAANSDYIVVNDKQYNLGGEETIYTITMEYKNKTDYTNGNVDTVTVSEGGKISKGDMVAYTLDGGDLDMVFVYEYVY